MKNNKIALKIRLKIPNNKNKTLNFFSDAFNKQG